MAPPGIAEAPAPWTLRGTIYILPFWVPSSQSHANLPPVATHPLEASLAASSSQPGDKHIGGLSTVQIVRYTDSPVGPYDELIIAPGKWEFDVDDVRTGRRAKRRNVRISRIYVSQKQTCWNGRTNWNLCKHLARFDFTTSGSSTTVAVYPHDLDPASDESAPSTVPFFQATFSPVAYAPSFPMRMSVASLVGIDITIAHPPLPAGPQPELAGTTVWHAVVPTLSAKRTRIGWFDRRQGDVRPDGVAENFWPGWRRWGMGVVMEDAVFGFDVGESWEPVKTAE